jgi:hypothetical protein
LSATLAPLNIIGLNLAAGGRGRAWLARIIISYNNI